MQIKELKPKQGSVELTADVVEKGEIREFNKFGTPGKVCNATISDASGTMKITLWNDQIDQVGAGDTIKITNGYVNEWQGEKQLTTGKFGKLEVVKKGTASADTSKPAPSAGDSDSSSGSEEDEIFDVEEEDVD